MRSLDDGDDQEAQRRQAAYIRSQSDLSSGSQQGFIPYMDTLGSLSDELTFTLYPFISSAQDGCRDSSHSSRKCWGCPRPQVGLPEALSVSVSTQPRAKAICLLGSNTSQCSKDMPISHDNRLSGCWVAHQRLLSKGPLRGSQADERDMPRSWVDSARKKCFCPAGEACGRALSQTWTYN